MMDSAETQARPGRAPDLGEAISASPSSQVFAATDAETGASCVVKVYAEAAQATREARALEALGGGLAPRLLARRTVDGAPALVMERFEGRTLEVWAGDVPEAEREEGLGRVLAGLADALSAVHAKGLVHGDLKPDHVVIGADGRVRLLDFASAAAAGERATAADARWLTPGYSAPECDPSVAGDQPLGAWSDYFSVGAILLWLAEGRAPVAGDFDQPPSGQSGLAEAARKLLRREPSDRPLSEAEFRAVLLADFDLDETTVIPVAKPAPVVGARDPIPPTEKVRARQPGKLPDPPVIEAPRRQGGVGWLTVTLCLALLAAAGWGGYTYGWPLYQKLYKTVWVVDPAGAGDALTLEEALRRAGPDVEIRLVAGEHLAAPIVNRSVALGPMDGLAVSPVIVGGAETCLTLQGARVFISGVKITRVGDAPTGGCLEAIGGETALAGVAIERSPEAGLSLAGGALARLNEVEVSNPKGAGLVIAGGAEVEALGLIIGGAEGPGAVVAGGGALTGADVKIIAAGASGLAVGGGGSVVLDALEVDGAAGTGLELTEGASVTLTGALIDSSGGGGAALYNGARLTMTEGVITGSALTGVFADGAEELSLSNMKVIESGEHGALLLDVRRGAITSSEITGSAGIGLGVFPGADVTLTENRVEENEAGDVIDARPPPSEEPDPGVDPAATAASDDEKASTE